MASRLTSAVFVSLETIAETMSRWCRTSRGKLWHRCSVSALSAAKSAPQLSSAQRSKASW